MFNLRQGNKMDVSGRSKGQPFIGVSKGAAALNFRQPRTPAAEAVMQSPFFQRLLYIVRLLFSPIFSFQKFVLYECEDFRALPRMQVHPALHVTTYDASLAVPDEVAAVAAPRPGESLSAVYVANRPVGYLRAAFKDMPAPDSGMVVKIGAGSVYLFELFIHPEFRGTGLAKYLLVSAMRDFRSRGFGKVVTGRLLAADSSNHEMERLGFRAVQEITAYRILGQHINVVAQRAK